MKYKRLDAVIALLGVFFAGNALATVSAYDKIDGSTSLSKLTSSTSLSSSVSDVESSITDVEDDVSTNTTSISDLETSISTLSDSVEAVSSSDSDSDSDSNVRGVWVYDGKSSESVSGETNNFTYANYPIFLGQATSSSGYKNYIGDSCVEGIGGYVTYQYYSKESKSSYKYYSYKMSCE